MQGHRAWWSWLTAGVGGAQWGGGVAASQLCVECHDFEQSPDFLYGTEWPKIEHGLEPHMKK